MLLFFLFIHIIQSSHKLSLSPLFFVEHYNTPMIPQPKEEIRKDISITPQIKKKKITCLLFPYHLLSCLYTYCSLKLNPVVRLQF